ncbi:MAG: pentapeptide repeat-containing protein [Chloroflexota bacterium]
MIKILFITSIIFVLQFSEPILVKQAYAHCSSKPIPGVNWEGCRKRNLILSGTDLKNSNFRATNFTSTDMRRSEIDGANFRKAVVIRAAFDEASATGNIFEAAHGYRASFRKSNLTNAIFYKSEFMRVDFSGSVLTGADFSKSDLGRTRFDDAILGNSNFAFANVARADFRNAILTGPITLNGAYLFQTRFEGVDLSKSVGLLQWQIDMACGDNSTRLPAGISKPKSWPCGSD